jgi:hypothetical protein
MKEAKSSIAKYLAEIGAKGGKKSKRKLTKKQARAMAERRWGTRKTKKEKT